MKNFELEPEGGQVGETTTNISCTTIGATDDAVIPLMKRCPAIEMLQYKPRVEVVYQAVQYRSLSVA